MSSFLKLFGLVFSLVFSLQAHAEQRVALIIGNGAYVHVPQLRNAANDARLLADTLQSLGFRLVGGRAHLNLDKASLDAIVQRFGSELRGADAAVFFYAGHGLQIRGNNYLVPISANPVRESDADFLLTDVSAILRQMEDGGSKLNVVMLDACRNNPFAGRGLRSSSAGLAQMIAPEGTIISFATQPGSVAQDGEGNNSPYSLAIAEALKTPNLDIFQLFNQAGLLVRRATKGEQTPWLSSSPIAGSFSFSKGSSGPKEPSSNACKDADAHWRRVENQNVRTAFEEHISRFPNCGSAAMAKQKLQALSAVAVQTQPAAATRPRQPTMLSNLYPPSECHPSKPYKAKVVTRKFLEDNPVIMNGVTLESDDGTRAYVNIDISSVDDNAASRGTVIRELQEFLREGRTIEVSIKLCGAGGRVYMLDSVRAIR